MLKVLTLFFLVTSQILLLCGASPMSFWPSHFYHLGAEWADDGKFMMVELTRDTAAAGMLLYEVPLTHFSTAFSFSLTKNSRSKDGEGLTFYIVADRIFSNIGEGANLGYAGLEHSLAVEFDLVQSSQFDDISNNHVGINTDGELTSIVSKNATFDLHNSLVYCWIDYAGGVLSIFISPSAAKPDTAFLNHSISLKNIVGNTGHMGFSCSTSDEYYSTIQIHSWDLVVGIDRLDFSTEAQVSGSASLEGGYARLTSNGPSQIGTVWKNTPVTLENSDSTFSSFFSFKVDGAQPYGDGFTLILAKEKTYQVEGDETLGYKGTPNSIAIEFDLGQYLSYSLIGLLVNGSMDPVEVKGIELDDDVNFCWVTYDGVTLNVYFDTTPLMPGSPFFSAEVNIREVVGKTFYVGFGASCTDSYAHQIIYDWEVKTTEGTRGSGAAPLSAGLWLLSLSLVFTFFKL